MARPAPKSNAGGQDESIEVLSGDEGHQGTNMPDETLEDDIVEVRPSTKAKAKTHASSSKPISNGKATARASTAKPASKQQRSPQKPSTSTTQNGASDESDDDADAGKASVSKRETRLLRENEKLRKELQAAQEETARWRGKSDEYRGKWEQTGNLVNEQIDVPRYQDQIEDLVNQLEDERKENQHLQRSLKVFASIEEPGNLRFISAAQARQERIMVEEKVQALEKQIAQHKTGSNQALEEEEARHAETRKRLKEQEEEGQRRVKELEEEIKLLRQELQAEIDRQKTTAKSNTSGLSNGIVGDSSKMTIKLYEDLTNFLILSASSETDPETDLQQWIFKCMCTGTASQAGLPKSLNFTLRLFTNPDEEPTKDKDKFNQCKFIPHDLDKEKDDELAQQLEFLCDPFTFAKDQLDIFFRTLSDRLKKQPPDQEDMSMDESVEISGENAVPIKVDDD